MIAYVNVRHAGSGFVVRRLFEGKRVVDLLSADTPDRWDLGWTHVDEYNLVVIRKKLEMCSGIITTFRSAIAESCSKRGESLARLEREKALLFDLMGEYEIIGIHLEIPELRDRELAVINERFGLSLKTDWARVPSLMDMR